MPTTFDPTATAAPIGSFVKTDDGEVINDTSYQELEFKPLARGIRYQELHSALDTTAAGALGDPDDANPGTFYFSGEVRTVDNGDGLAKIFIDAGTALEADPDGFVRAPCRKKLHRPRVPLTDADHTIDVSQGDRFDLPGNGAGTAVHRTITLDDTVVIPEDGETMTLFCDGDAGTIDASYIAYEFQRDDASVAARVYWFTTVGFTVDGFWLTFEYTGGAWKLAENSGALPYNDSGTWRYVGVRPV